MPAILLPIVFKAPNIPIYTLAAPYPAPETTFIVSSKYFIFYTVFNFLLFPINPLPKVLAVFTSTPTYPTE